MKRETRNFRSVMAWAVAAAFACSAQANPTGPTLINGSALTSNPNASTLQIVNTPGTIINWQGFSMAGGETTRFVQLNAASAVLNRVVGGIPSDILGRLESNGRVFLINPNGIVFGAGAVVDVAGLIASTRDISNADFLAGNYLFSGTGNGSITMQSGAQILTSTYGPGGQVWLFGKSVTQQAGSTITAPQGQVVLAAGSTLQVGTSGLGNMTFSLTTSGNDTVQSLGTIAADRGAVGLFADFVTHRGSIDAGSGGQVAMNATRELRVQGASTTNAPNGSITLRGGSLLEVQNDSVINADGANGRISFESNNLLVYPGGNTHAVGGSVTFNQTQPSQYSAGTVQPVPTGADGISLVFPDSHALVYRRSDGNYGLRYLNLVPLFAPRRDSFEIREIVFNSAGQVLSGPTLLATSDPAAPGSGAFVAANIFAQIPNSFNWSALQLPFGIVPPATRMPATGGNFIQNPDRPATGSTFTWNILSGSGAQIGTVSAALTLSPLADGTLIGGFLLGLPPLSPPFTPTYTLSGPTGAVISTTTGSVVNLMPLITVPTPDGGFNVIYEQLGSLLNVAALQHWTKVVPAYTTSNFLTGTAGIAANFATAPGVPPASAPPPAPPPVVFGSGSGATFAGVSGCNSAVCSAEVIAAKAAAEALLAAAQAAPGGAISRIDEAVARRAVDALRQAGTFASADDSASAQATAQVDRALQNPAMQTLIDDNGSLGRLMRTRFDALPPEARLIAYQNWLRAEAVAQATGSDSSRSDAATFTAIVAGMDDIAVRTWLDGIAQCQRAGTC